MSAVAQFVNERSIIDAALADLRKILDDRATAGLAVREHHSHGESSHPPGMPDIVCFPLTTEEVSAIAKISARHRLPMIPFGAGTSLEGHVHATRGGISIDLSRMNQILQVRPDDMDATVQAGVTRDQLGKAVQPSGLTFFIDPGANATLGGMASTRASGTTAVRYGTMRENVLGLTVVLADGRIIHTGTRARKSSAGYDLTRLFVGAEGTLGIITELTLRLHALPEALAVVRCAFATINGAVETASEVIQLGLSPARIEFMDDKLVRAINRYSHTELLIAPTLLFEFHDISEAALAETASFAERLCVAHDALNFAWETSPEGRDRLWKARHDAYYATRALRPGSLVLTTDVCVPISRLAECVVAARAEIDSSSFEATIVGHVGDGNFHVLCLYAPEQAAEVEGFAARLVEVALSMNGTCTGEHGIGVGKMKYLEAEHGDAIDVMRSLKRSLDPDNRMNPGKVVRLE